MAYELLKKHKSFDGETIFCEHESASTKTKMKFSAFLPKDLKEIKNAIIWLSGLTCNEENFITKSGVQRCLADSDTMIICPDTSPRGLSLPKESESYDFGTGAGFYVNATTEGYKGHYKMYDYISKDLINILRNDFGVSSFSITGHSMGGHGALILGLREKGTFKTISAFSPIVNPVVSPWGQKALKGYLGPDTDTWKQYDACELVGSGNTSNSKILIDQGLDDEFYEKELLTQNFEKICKSSSQSLLVNYREGYDHSYYFISSFIKNHIDYHLENFN